MIEYMLDGPASQCLVLVVWHRTKTTARYSPTLNPPTQTSPEILCLTPLLRDTVESVMTTRQSPKLVGKRLSRKVR